MSERHPKSREKSTEQSLTSAVAGRSSSQLYLGRTEFRASIFAAENRHKNRHTLWELENCGFKTRSLEFFLLSSRTPVVQIHSSQWSWVAARYEGWKVVTVGDRM